MSVYFARVKGYVKIGFSDDPISRMSTIATGTCIKPADVNYGDKVDLFGWIPGDRHTEASMHRAFGNLAVTAEWFWDDAAYEELIEAHPFGVPMNDVPVHVAVWMQNDPSLSRADAMAIWDAMPKESGIFSDEFVAGITERATARRAKDRAYWRSMRQDLAA